MPRPGVCRRDVDSGSLAGMGCAGMTGPLPDCAALLRDFWPSQAPSLSVMVAHHPEVTGTLGYFVGLWTVWGTLA